MQDAHTATMGKGRQPADPLSEPIVIAQFEKNRRGEKIRVTLRTYEGVPLIDLRTWYPSGDELKPGKGMTCGVRHLPALAQAVADALAKAKELGLVEAGG